MNSMKSAYDTVIQRIEQAQNRYNRAPGSIKLLAVSKTKPVENIRELANLGQCEFAENYLQEAIDKQQQLKDLSLSWHFIGHIQSNKTRQIAENFAWVHSVDRLKIATRLNAHRQLPSPLNICIQVNIESEQSKSGCSVENLPDLAFAISKLDRLKLRGLMVIPAVENTFEAQHHVFSKLSNLLIELNKAGLNLDTLSMGMTNDLEAAISAGATYVRIGTALFGARNYN